MKRLLFGCLVVADSLWPHGPQHTRIPCPSLSPGAWSNSCPLSQWGHANVSFSVIPFSYYLQSCPAQGSFPMSWLFISGGQSTRTSALTSGLPMNTQDWFTLGFAGLIPLLSKGFSRVFYNTIAWKHQFFRAQASLWSNSHSSVQFSSVAQLCPTLCDPMDCSTPGHPAHHQLPNFIQTHVHWVRDAKQPSHLLSPTSSPAISLSQHQGLFKWVTSSHQVVKVLEFLQLQHQSFQWIFGADFH